MPESLEDRIIRHEGFCNFPKYDAKGFYVIGFGHDITKDQAENTYVHGVNRQEALDLLEEDITRCKEESGKAFPWLLGLSEERQSVIIEMVFQMGIGGVEAFHKMIAAIRIGDFATAAKEMLESQWHQQTPSRAEELANIMLTGESSDA